MDEAGAWLLPQAGAEAGALSQAAVPGFLWGGAHSHYSIILSEPVSTTPRASPCSQPQEDEAQLRHF